VRFEHITRADLLRLREQGWQDKPAGPYEPDHAPKNARFVIIDDIPTSKFRRLYPPQLGKHQ
jgi:hypothetical protein